MFSLIAIFVCNGCPNDKKCRINKHYYSAFNDEQNYKQLLVDSRIGIDQTIAEFKELNKIVKDDIDKDHSFALIINDHPELEISERNLYNYQEKLD